MRRYMLFAGIAAPIVYVATVLVGGAITPGYDHLSQPVSALFETGAVYATPISAAFVAYNMLLLVFGAGLLVSGRMDRRILQVGAVMILFNGLFGVLIELAPMDAQGTPVTVPGIVHMVLAGLLVLTCIAALGAMAWGWRARFMSPLQVKENCIGRAGGNGVGTKPAADGIISAVDHRQLSDLDRGTRHNRGARHPIMSDQCRVTSLSAAAMCSHSDETLAVARRLPARRYQ